MLGSQHDSYTLSTKILSGVSRLACRRIIRFVYDVIASEEEFARMWVVEPVFIYTESITVSHEYGLDCLVVEFLSFVLRDVDKLWPSLILTCGLLPIHAWKGVRLSNVVIGNRYWR